MELRSESISNDSMEELRRIFDLCDEYNQGFIPVQNFIQVFKRHLEVSTRNFDTVPEEKTKKPVVSKDVGNESTLSNEEEEELIKFFDPDSDGLMSFADFVNGVESLRAKESAERSGDTTYESFSSNGSSSSCANTCEVS